MLSFYHHHLLWKELELVFLFTLYSHLWWPKIPCSSFYAYFHGSILFQDLIQFGVKKRKFFFQNWREKGWQNAAKEGSNFLQSRKFTQKCDENFVGWTHHTLRPCKIVQYASIRIHKRVKGTHLEERGGCWNSDGMHGGITFRVFQKCLHSKMRWPETISM